MGWSMSLTEMCSLCVILLISLELRILIVSEMFLPMRMTSSPDFECLYIN